MHKPWPDLNGTPSSDFFSSVTTANELRERINLVGSGTATRFGVFTKNDFNTYTIWLFGTTSLGLIGVSKRQG